MKSNSSTRKTHFAMASEARLIQQVMFHCNTKAPIPISYQRNGSIVASLHITTNSSLKVMAPRVLRLQFLQPNCSAERIFTQRPLICLLAMAAASPLPRSESAGWSRGKVVLQRAPINFNILPSFLGPFGSGYLGNSSMPLLTDIKYHVLIT